MLQLWHRRLGHCGVDRLRLAVRNNLAAGMDEIDGQLDNCKACIKESQRKDRFQKGVKFHRIICWIWYTQMCVGHFQPSQWEEQSILLPLLMILAE